MSQSQHTTALRILALVMVVNALSYGTMIPLLYPYAARFGVDPFWLGILFASYSIFQFVATPIMGRLSDVYGRKPLLVASIFGTSLSLALFASAWSAPVLFLARILDGITGGNNSIAQAMMADITTGEERTKAFGYLGAAFGFGFLVGPALGGLLSQISLQAPFWFAAALALLATILSVVFLPETLSDAVSKKAEKKSGTLFVTPQQIFAALRYPVVGTVLLVGFLSMTAHQAYVVGWNSYAIDNLGLSAAQVGLVFSGFGVISVLVQTVGIKILLQLFTSKALLLRKVLLFSAIIATLNYSQTNIVLFIVFSLSYAGSFVPQTILTSAMISERSKPEDQGSVLGINQSFQSLGQIMGPLLASLTSLISVPLTFVIAAGIYFLGYVLSRKLQPR